jgi:hypothetical protein
MFLLIQRNQQILLILLIQRTLMIPKNLKIQRFLLSHLFQQIQ